LKFIEVSNATENGRSSPPTSEALILAFPSWKRLGRTPPVLFARLFGALPTDAVTATQKINGIRTQPIFILTRF
jgi:hypothetical protein